jgi:hypothetical protein
MVGGSGGEMAADSVAGWLEDPGFADDRRAWFLAIGPWALGVYEHAGGLVTWGVSGPDGGEDLDTDGVASDLAAGMRAAVEEVRRRWAGFGHELRHLEPGADVAV